MQKLLNNKFDWEKTKGFRALYWLLFALIWAFLFWRCRYGYADADESFYLTIPYRMCQGDKLFLHEWHLSQTSSLLLWPIMRIYLALFKGTAGIALHFRWIFTAVWGFAAIFIERRLQLFSETGAKLSALVFLIFTANGIMALNYNSLGILLLASSCIICISSVTACRFPFYCAGLLLAGAVLCCPYLLILYIGFSLAALVAFIMKKKDIVFCWFFVSLGALTVFLLFCVYLLSNAPLSEYWKVFPYLLQDPQHESVSVFRKTWILFSSAYLSSPLFLPGMGLAVIITAAAYLSGKHREGFAGICLISAALLLSYWTERKALMNQLMFPLSIVGLYCAIVSDDRTSRKVFLGLWLPGFVYGFCINLASSQMFFAFSSVSLLMSMASIVMACRYINTETSQSAEATGLKTGKWLIPVFTILMVIQLGCELGFRYEKVYWDRSGIRNQTVLAETGPDRGIMINEDKSALYKQATVDLEEICSRPEIEKLLVVSDDCGFYLLAEKEFATYSSWLYDVDALDPYYSLFPEKTPDAIYITGTYHLQSVPKFLENGFVLARIDEEAETAILYPA